MKFRSIAAVFAAFFGLAPVAAPAASYVIDTKGQHAAITFRVKHLGYSFIVGRFNTFSGNFSFDDKNPGASTVKVDIATASVDTNYGERDKHLKGPDLLDVEQFPTATFESTSVTANGDGKAKIAGKLTLHGVTKDIVIDATHVGGGADPWGGYRDGFTGTTTITLKDFAIKRDLGPATKDVELTLDVEGVRQ